MCTLVQSEARLGPRLSLGGGCGLSVGPVGEIVIECYLTARVPMV